MKIELHEIPIYEVADGYHESEESGVVGYGGRLNIRPAFQREFIYDEEKRDNVIRSIRNNFPLNIMYWICNEGGMYEMLDGQQRTISICRYLDDSFSVDKMKFGNLTMNERNQILNYKLMIYFCDGEEEEKRDWFNIVNMAGEELTPQELRNAIYPGTWLTDAKKRFSRRNCPAQKEAGNYLSGESIRQDYLATVLRWIADSKGCKGKPDDMIRRYMSEHQRDSDAGELWLYFQNVINWVKSIFPEYTSEMKKIQWGMYYNRHHEDKFDAKDLAYRLKVLRDDDDVTSPSGIYEYLIDGQEKHLNLRQFRPKDKRAAYERQNGKCNMCGKEFALEDMQADHITPWSKGGHTTSDNCQMLCRKCNSKKGNK